MTSGQPYFLMKILFDHYSGFEGESGVRFVRDWGSDTAEAFDLWDGYFDPIMEALYELYWGKKLIPYLSLLRDWNECLGFAGVPADAVSVLGDLAAFLDALRRVDLPLLIQVRQTIDRSHAEKVLSVATDLTGFLQSALSAGQTVAVLDE